MPVLNYAWRYAVYARRVHPRTQPTARVHAFEGMLCYVLAGPA